MIPTQSLGRTSRAFSDYFWLQNCTQFPTKLLKKSASLRIGSCRPRWIPQQSAPSSPEHVYSATTTSKANKGEVNIHLCLCNQPWLNKAQSPCPCPQAGWHAAEITARIPVFRVYFLAQCVLVRGYSLPHQTQIPILQTDANHGQHLSRYLQ